MFVIAPSTIWLLYFSVNIQQGVSGCECDMRIYTPSTLLQKILEKILNGLEFEEVSGIFSLWYYRKSQRWQRREEEQLSEYWDSGLTIQEYSELKELPYESTRRWIRVLQKARQDDASDPESLELVEVKLEVGKIQQ